MTFSAPRAGLVLDALIEVFDLRRWDADGTLSFPTSRRYLSGQRVKDDSEWSVFQATADAFIASSLMPSVITPADLLPSERAAELVQALNPRDLLAAFLSVYARRWDELVGKLAAWSAPIAFPRQIAGAYLRLVAIDVAVRLGALLWLQGARDGSLTAPLWARPKGGALCLKGILNRCGDRRPTREQLLDELGVEHVQNPKTVDSWLDGKHHPIDAHKVRLAKVLAARGAGDEESLAREIRLTFGLELLVRKIAQIVGQQRAEEMAMRLVAYANEVPRFVRNSSRPPELLDGTMKLTLVGGVFPNPPPWLPPILNHIRRQERDPVWRTDLHAVTRPWVDRLQLVARKLGPVDLDEFRREVGRDPADGELDEIAYCVQASQDELMAEPIHAAATVALVRDDPMAAARESQTAGTEAAQGGDLIRAIEMARSAVGLDPTNAEYHFRLGAYLGQVGDLDEGMRECEIAAALDPAWDRPKVEVAVILQHAGRVDEALAHLESAKLALPETTPWLLFVLGLIREELQDVEGAITAFEALLQQEPEHGEALDRIAHLYFVVGRGNDARRSCKEAHQRGYSTVHQAWRDGYYRTGGARPRPAATGTI